MSFGKFGEFGKSSAIRQSKLVYLYDVFFRQTFFHQTLEMSKFTKLSTHQTFPLYGMLLFVVVV